MTWVDDYADEVRYPQDVCQWQVDGLRSRIEELQRKLAIWEQRLEAHQHDTDPADG